MKKQFILGLCLLSIISCTSTPNSKREYSTLADIFVWNENDKKVEKTPRGVEVSYKENQLDPSSKERVVEHSDYKFNDDINVKYLDVKRGGDNSTQPSAQEEVIVKEVIIETDTPNENVQTYTLAKRSERYKDIYDQFSPNVYAVIASRTVNKFLTDIPAYFADKETPKLYIEETVYADRFMPSNPDVVGTTTKEIIEGSKMIAIVDNKNEATNVLKGRVSNINTPEVPVFKYEIGLFNKNNKLIDKWSETIRQVQNDDGSWW